MSLLIQTIIIGVIAGIIYFISPGLLAGWVVWFGYLIFAVLLFYKGMVVKGQMAKGVEGDLTAATMLPPAMFLVGVVLIGFLFLDFSKLHLLWLAPLVTLLVEIVIGRRIHEAAEGEIEKITSKQ